MSLKDCLSSVGTGECIPETTSVVQIGGVVETSDRVLVAQ